MVKNPPANAGDPTSIPESGRSPGEGNGNPLQYSCLENPMDRGAWQAAVCRVAKSQTQLKRLSTHMSPTDTLQVSTTSALETSCSKKPKCIWRIHVMFIQFSSVAQSCPTLYNPMNRSTPGLPVHHQLPELTQTHAHQVSDAMFIKILLKRKKQILKAVILNMSLHQKNP